MKVGRFDVTEETSEHGQVRVLSMRTGGNPEHFGDGYLALSLAMHALHGALCLLHVAPEHGPAPAAIVLPHVEFIRLRDALVAEGKGGDFMFKRPRRKKIDPNRLVTMLRGITIMSDAADFALVDLMRCPMRAPKRGES